MPTRKITASIRDQIRALAEVLYEFLPLSSRSKKTVTFTSIFAESGVRLEGESKKPVLQAGWEEVVRRHPRLPFTLIRKIVPAAVDYRRYKRNPLKKVELDKLAKCLCDLDYNMNNELSAVQVDETVPEIQVPPAELVKRLESHPLVEAIQTEPLEMFRNGHFNESVRKAAERFEVEIQKRTGRHEIGKELMGKVFSGAVPLIALNSQKTDNEKGIQEGYMLMTMGMMLAVRNIFSHGDENQRRPEEAFEMLMFLNWLFIQLP